MKMWMAVFLILLMAVNTNAQEAAKAENKVETGELNGAAFHIEMPSQWNQVLVMYCHGYQLAGTKPNLNDPRLKLLSNAFASRGFAFAQSAYRAQGWAVKEAVEDTEALRRHFIANYGKPSETYVMGHSMGAVITLATIEKHPDIYQGAMPLCGPLNAILNGLQERVFDMLVTFDHLFPDVVGSLVNLPRGSRLNVPKAKLAVEAAPEKATMYAKRYSIATVNELANVLAFFYEINRELQERAGGNPFDNRNTIYDGFDDDAALNRGVKRYPADAKAREYLRQYYTPTGRISDPVLTMHTTYDQLIPGRYISEYDSIAKLAGTQDLFVAKFVVARGHCNFTLPQTTAAFDELLNWARTRKAPSAGEMK